MYQMVIMQIAGSESSPSPGQEEQKSVHSSIHNLHTRCIYTLQPIVPRIPPAVAVRRERRSVRFDYAVHSPRSHLPYLRVR